MIHQQDILEDILSRLPAKSIARFRCVSKPWRSLLSQPRFIKNHLNRIKHSSLYQQQSIILFSHQQQSINPFYPWRQHVGRHHDITSSSINSLHFGSRRFDSDVIPSFGEMASCDGLTLLEDVKQRWLLVNPTTREFKKLPKLRYTNPHDFSYTLYGVGYDSLTDDYKVVTIFVYFTDNDLFNMNETNFNEAFVSVYSVRNGTWKRVANSPYNHNDKLFLTSGVYVDGHIHWLARVTSHDEYVIVAFDLVQEKFRELPSPGLPEGNSFGLYRYLGHLYTLGGCLCMFPGTRVHQTNVDFWVMKVYGIKESWTKFTIADTGEVSTLRPLCLLGQELVMMKDEEPHGTKMVMYNLKEKRFKDVVIHGIPDVFGARGILPGGTFTESLVSPNCSIEAAREEE